MADVTDPLPGREVSHETGSDEECRVEARDFHVTCHDDGGSFDGHAQTTDESSNGGTCKGVKEIEQKKIAKSILIMLEAAVGILSLIHI